jgi:hypothetical protein
MFLAWIWCRLNGKYVFGNRGSTHTHERHARSLSSGNTTVWARIQYPLRRESVLVQCSEKSGTRQECCRLLCTPCEHVACLDQHQRLTGRWATGLPRLSGPVASHLRPRASPPFIPPHSTILHYWIIIYSFTYLQRYNVKTHSHLHILFHSNCYR